jgi:hypothetical protein
MEKQQTAVEKLFRVFMDNNRTLTLSDFENALKKEENQIKNAWVACAESENNETDKVKLFEFYANLKNSSESYYNNQYK